MGELGAKCNEYKKWGEIMDKKQLKLLKYLYRGTKTKEQVKKKFHMDDEAIQEYFLNDSMRQYIDLIIDYPGIWDGMFKIKPDGNSKVEEENRWLFNEVRAWITAAIAVAAFIKSFFL